MRPQPAAESLVVQLQALMGDASGVELLERFHRACDDFLYLEKLAGSKVMPEVSEYDTGGLSARRSGGIGRVT